MYRFCIRWLWSLVSVRLQEKQREKYILCDPALTFRTLYFPWRGGATSASQGSLLIRRNEILESNKLHLTRRLLHTTTKELNILDKLHETIGHLGQLSQRDKTKAHLAHPTLVEIFPTFVAEGDDAPPFNRVTSELFGRVRYGASLDEMTDYRGDLCTPAISPYGLFGVSPQADLRRALGARVLSAKQPQGSPPDICIIDLGSPGLRRLGPNWIEAVEAFVSETNKRYPALPFLVVTQSHSSRSGLQHCFVLS